MGNDGKHGAAGWKKMLELSGSQMGVPYFQRLNIRGLLSPTWTMSGHSD